MKELVTGSDSDQSYQEHRSDPEPADRYWLCNFERQPSCHVEEQGKICNEGEHERHGVDSNQPAICLEGVLTGADCY